MGSAESSTASVAGRRGGGAPPVVEASAAACGAEHSRKHFTSYQHLCLLLFHGLSSHPSLRQSYEHFAACAGLVAG